MIIKANEIENSQLIKENLLLKKEVAFWKGHAENLSESIRKQSIERVEDPELQQKYNELLEDYYALKEEIEPLRQLVLINLRNKAGKLA